MVFLYLSLRISSYCCKKKQNGVPRSLMRIKLRNGCSFLFLMVVWKNFLPLIHSSVEVLQSTLHLLTFQGFGETAQTLVRVASVEHEVKGAVGAVGGVLREIPSTAIRPIIIASQATTNVLDGVRSQLVPDARTEAALKWRSDYFWKGCLFGRVDVSGVIVSFID